jgi:hypothetical protein
VERLEGPVLLAVLVLLLEVVAVELVGIVKNSFYLPFLGPQKQSQ